MSLLTRLIELKKIRDPYRPLIEIKIFRDNLLFNLHACQAAAPKLQLAPVLKSNAYGHGLVEVARILRGQRLPFCVIDSLFEARVLRHGGIRHPLLIIGYTATDNIISHRLNNIAFTITSLDQLREIAAKLTRHSRFHLKFDTGMRRQGLMPDQLAEAARLAKNNPNIIVEGICSHLSDADGESEEYTKKQIALWNSLAGRAQSLFGELPYRHLANTAGLAFQNGINANVGRLGLGLYGFTTSPRPANAQLLPALAMESVVTSIRPLKARESIGYNKTFTAPRDMLVATVPAGYAEGIDRRLSNTGAMMIGGAPCPIIGRVSMNITSIDVSNVAGATLGQKVTLISENPQHPNSVAGIAKLCNTIPYEILVHIPGYLRRLAV